MSQKTKVYDLLIVGGGPTGISAALSAASEGFSTILVDANPNGFGGQAGTSSLIENFFGFPEGVSGQELTARGMAQAYKFKVDFCTPFRVTSIKKQDNMFAVIDDDGDVFYCYSVLLAMGVQYKIHDAANMARFTGLGISYGSPSLSENFTDKVIAIIGGANSAGQAAVHLASCPDCEVKLIVRGPTLDKMSTYLLDKLSLFPNIEVITNTTVVAVNGTERLEELTLDSFSKISTLKVDRLFVLIGAKAKTNWLQGVVALDEHGFIESVDMEAAPGIFVAGDIRSGSIKRVASAVGEGAQAVNKIRSFLSTLKIAQLT